MSLSSAKVFGHAEVAAVLLLELGLQLRPLEPVLAIGPADHVAEGRQRPVVGRVLRPFGVADHGGGDEVVHLDAVGIEEVVQLDVLAVLGGAADPLAVADHQVAELAAGIQLVEHPVGEIRPGHELEMHRVAGLAPRSPCDSSTSAFAGSQAAQQSVRSSAAAWLAPASSAADASRLPCRIFMNSSQKSGGDFRDQYLPSRNRERPVRPLRL